MTIERQLEDLYNPYLSQVTKGHVRVPDRGITGVIAAHTVASPPMSRRAAYRPLPSYTCLFGTISAHGNTGECGGGVMLASRTLLGKLSCPYRSIVTDGWQPRVSLTVIAQMRGLESASKARSPDSSTDRLLLLPPLTVSVDKEKEEVKDGESGK